VGESGNLKVDCHPKDRGVIERVLKVFQKAENHSGGQTKRAQAEDFWPSGLLRAFRRLRLAANTPWA
jgi:hypothetical protein